MTTIQVVLLIVSSCFKRNWKLQGLLKLSWALGSVPTMLQWASSLITIYGVLKKTDPDRIILTSWSTKNRNKSPWNTTRFFFFVPHTKFIYHQFSLFVPRVFSRHPSLLHFWAYRLKGSAWGLLWCKTQSQLCQWGRRSWVSSTGMNKVQRTR